MCADIINFVANWVNLFLLLNFVVVAGFEGAFCEVEIDDCEHNQVECLNGGFCIDLANDYRCACATGFAGHNCERLDESVCEVSRNQVWHWNNTDASCEQVCLCQPDEPSVGCVCRQHLEAGDRLGHCSDWAMVNETELRVVFDHVLTGSASSAVEACDTIFALHELINGNASTTLDDVDDAEEFGGAAVKGKLAVGDFCCHAVAPNEIRVRVKRANVLARYITRNAFPRLLHVVVDMKQFEKTNWLLIKLIMTVLLIALLLAVAQIVFKSYLRRKYAAADAENVVIHCIQNNLQGKNRAAGLSAKPRSLEPSPVSNYRLELSKMYHDKLCNTLQRNWKVTNSDAAAVDAAADVYKQNMFAPKDHHYDDSCEDYEEKHGNFKTAPFRIKLAD